MVDNDHLMLVKQGHKSIWIEGLYQSFMVKLEMVYCVY